MKDGSKPTSEDLLITKHPALAFQASRVEWVEYRIGMTMAELRADGSPERAIGELDRIADEVASIADTIRKMTSED